MAYIEALPPGVIVYGGANIIDGMCDKFFEVDLMAMALGEGVTLLTVYEIPGAPLRNVDLYQGYISTESGAVLGTASALLPFSVVYMGGDLHFFVNGLDGQGHPLGGESGFQDDFFINGVLASGFVFDTDRVGNAWIGKLGPNGQPPIRNLYDKVNDDVSAVTVPGDTAITIATVRPLVGGRDCIGHSFAAVSFPLEPDCNNNGILDPTDIASDTSQDCNANGIPDECDIDPADPDGDGLVSADCQLDAIPDECQTSSFTYQLDDGTGEFSDGLPNGGSVAWMNRFTVRANSETIGSIRLAWGPVANGTPATVYLWSDPNGDGDPTDAQVLASAATTVQFSDTNIFTNVAILDTFVGPAGTSFFAGAILTHQAGERPIPLDSDSPVGPTWLVGDETVPIDPNDLAAAEIPPFVADAGVALVRAVAPGDDCNNSGVPDICEGSDDVALFVGELIAAVPNPLLTCFFDRNVDGKVDGLDIQPFVDHLLSGP